LRGPLVATSAFRRMAIDPVTMAPGEAQQRQLIAVWIFLYIPFAIGLFVLASPYREVTQPPARWYWLLELILPGTARQWGRWGGVVLAGMIWAVTLIRTIATDWTHFSFHPNIVRAFGLPPSFQDVSLSVGEANLSGLWNHGIVAVAAIIVLANIV